jgi:hypothetical protein
MYKCKECGATFDVPFSIKENHGFNDGSYEEWYVCPRCRDNNYVRYMNDNASRTEVVDKLVDILLILNNFDERICKCFNGCATENTELDEARSELCDFLVYLCNSEDFELPNDIDEKLIEMSTSSEAANVQGILLEYVEE